MGRGNKQLVYIAPSMQQAYVSREGFLRSKGNAIIGKKFMTEAVFINELWKLAANFILETPSCSQIYATICSAFKKLGQNPEVSKVGQVYQLIRNAGILLCSDDILTKYLSVNEENLLELARTYFLLLEEQGFLDPSKKYFDFDKSIFEGQDYEFVFLPGAVPSLCFKEFCIQNNFEFSILPECQIEKPSAEMQFTFPAGEYSKAKLVLDMIDAKPDCKTVLLSSKEPMTIFDQLKIAAMQKNYQIRVNDTFNFFLTDFGKAIFGLFNFLRFEKDYRFNELYAFLSSRFSGYSLQEAMDLDRSLRAERRKKAGNPRDIIYKIKKKSQCFKILVYIFENSEFSEENHKTLHDFVSELGFTMHYRELQHNAIDAFYDFTQAFSSTGNSLEIAMKILKRIRISLHYESVAEDPDKKISICSLHKAGNFRPGSFDQCIICDLNSRDYPMTQRGNSIDLMLKKMGFSPENNYQESLRDCFAKALKIPTKSLVLERALNNEDADELYPASVLEEFASLYMRSDEGPDDLVKPYYLP
ncbi:MAG: hypothetical protein HUJ51_01520, partial [Eggerthellaceae bacterium]|nr:hypothetical protein [Eggerthellaceae bacterium]